MIQKQNSLCISIRSLKRKEYLKQCLDSLLSNEGVENADFYLIQDGAVNPFSGIRHATDKEVYESALVFIESKLPNKTIHIFSQNQGLPLMRKHQLDTLFPFYKYIVMIDNDVVFNKYYIKTLKVLFKQFKNDSLAGTIQTSFKHINHTLQRKEEAKRLEDQVSYGFSHRWELGVWRETWEKIAPFMYDCWRLTKKCDYKELRYNSNVLKKERASLMSLYKTLAVDFIVEKSAIKAGYKGIHTLTLRQKTIGREGSYSFRNSRFDEGIYDKIQLYQVGNIEKYKLI